MGMDLDGHGENAADVLDDAHREVLQLVNVHGRFLLSDLHGSSLFT